MEQLSGFPFYPVEFGPDGRILKPDQVADLLAGLSGASDLIVISHGWNNDIAEARWLYTSFFVSARKVLDEQPSLASLRDRNFAVMGIFWPSKRFTDAELIPGGMASIAESPERETVLRALDLLAELHDSPEQKRIIEQARAQVDQLEASPPAQDAWVRSILDLFDEPDAGDRVEEGIAGLRTVSGSELLDKLSAPVIFPLEDDGTQGGALSAEAGGAAAGIGSLLSGVMGGAAKLLNLTTYYTMKDRAGQVGSTGAHDVVAQAQQSNSALRIHLIGHSFGGRLVSALAKGRAGAAKLRISSLSLLQAAFSHYGFSNNAANEHKDGFFRPVIAEGVIQGPAVITHSKNDTAVGYAYAVASRISGQNAAALGDADDQYGGIGRNGAQLTPEAVLLTLQQPGGAYALTPGKLHNLNGDAIIQNHGDVTNPPVAYACLTAMR